MSVSVDREPSGQWTAETGGVRIWLWGWRDPDARNAITDLQARGVICVQKWVADNPKVDSSFVRFLYNHPDLGQSKILRRDIGLTSDELVKFLEMFSREPRSRGVDFHEQAHVAKVYFRYFTNELQRQRIQHVLFEPCPITGLDYILYVAARRLGIATTMCLQSTIPGRFHYCHTLEDFGSFESARPEDQEVVIPALEWGFRKRLFYMDSKGGGYPPRFGYKWPRFLKELWRHGPRTSKRPLRLSGVVENLLQGLDFDRAYAAMAVGDRAIDWNAKYAYFPLHLQPELTTSGLGGRFSDQLDAIDELVAMLPQDWMVYAKENPKQGCEQRGREFFNRLRSMSRVRYLRKDVDTYKLLEGCQFIATITGTAGWEAVTGGKPCLVFGNPWYAMIPGVTRYRAGLTVEQVCSNISRRDQVLAGYRRIVQKTRRGVLDVLYATICDGYEASANARDIAEFITEVVQSEVPQASSCRWHADGR
jgi:hypothetical protein